MKLSRVILPPSTDTVDVNLSEALTSVHEYMTVDALGDVSYSLTLGCHNCPSIKHKTRHIYSLWPNISFSLETLIRSNYVRDNASVPRLCFNQWHKHNVV